MFGKKKPRSRSQVVPFGEGGGNPLGTAFEDARRRGKGIEPGAQDSVVNPRPKPKRPKPVRQSEREKDLDYLEAQRQRANISRVRRGVATIPKAKKYGGTR